LLLKLDASALPSMSAFITLPWFADKALVTLEESQQHIDAIQLTGSETLQQTDFSIAIDYNDLENKPTATPATEISDNKKEV
jgi:hypothetical protein